MYKKKTKIKFVYYVYRNCTRSFIDSFPIPINYPNFTDFFFFFFASLYIFRLDLVCAAGFISIIGAIVFLIDAILTFRSGSRGHLGD